MAPDFVDKRELRRVVGADVGATAGNAGGMLLLRRSGNPLTDYYHHGRTAGGTSSAVTATVARSTVTSNNRTNPGRRINHQRTNHQHHHHHHHHHHHPTHRIPLDSLGRGTAARNSDDIGPRASSAQDVCDNSNDSGLGFEERQQHLGNNAAWNGGGGGGGGGNVAGGEEDSKRRRMDIKLESEDANFAFPDVAHTANETKRGSSARTVSNGVAASISRSVAASGAVGRIVGVTRPRPAMGVLTKRPPPAHPGPVTLTSQLCSASRDGKTQLQIICQPEQQHRARYQTEGSRGAVKDRTGNGFPIVRLVGYDKPATLQVFIGTDLGRVAPHMFYQACRVSGKNSTPCIERKVDGTIVIEVDMDPAKDMLVTCDCVGILKERNVDVEHRFPQEAGILQGRSKKKSTRCRMVFRTTITHGDGTTETLQVCSQPIVCTQPPGIPEICKKSLTSCPCTGGLELFVLGKNFLKDTRIVFQLDNDDLSSSLEPHWECAVLPDKEFLQQTHLVCVVPPYRRQDLAPAETVSVKLYAVSSGKTSEPHAFMYTAVSTPPEPSIGKVECTTPTLTPPASSDSAMSTSPGTVPMAGVASNALIPQAVAGTTNFLTTMQQQQQQQQQQQPPASQAEALKSDPSPPPTGATSQVTPVMMWASQASTCQDTSEDVMMPPPALATNPLLNRRSSSGLQLILPDNLKTEVLDDNSQNSILSENSMQGLPTPVASGPAGTSPLQMVNDSPGEVQTGMIGAPNTSPVQEPTANLLGVVDLIRNPHPLTLATPHQTHFAGIHENSQVKVLSPHHINHQDSSAILSSEDSPTGNLQGGAGVVDLRMKHHQSEFDTLTSFPPTPPGQSLPAESSNGIEKYLNHLESVGTAPEEAEGENGAFVGTMQQRASIIATGRQQQQSPQPSNILAPTQATVKLDALVNSAAETHQIAPSITSVDTSPNSIVGHVSPVVESIHLQQHETMSSPQQGTRTSPPIPVKAMLIDALMQPPPVQSLAGPPSTSPTSASVPVVSEQATNEALLTSITAALLPPLQEPPIVTAAVTTTSPASVSVLNPLQVSSEPMPATPEHIQQMQALAQQDAVVMHQQAQQVEQVVAQAQQQVEQVVAQAQQQAVQAVQQAQQQVVQQVVQHAQVVQQAVQQVHAVQQVQAVPAVQHAVQQATQVAVEQAVQQATQEVVQQVQAVQQAVQQAQAAQAMQHAVQQDIGSMLNQPAGFVAEASSALASGAAQELSQQRLTTAAEQAINNVITNATQDIINNRPITTTTAHAIIATKNILNNVATQSAQLMNNAMEGILPKSPSGQGNVVQEQVGNKSPPAPISVSANRQNVEQAAPATSANAGGPVARKPEDAASMLPQELTSMSEHDLLSYINPYCFGL